MDAGRHSPLCTTDWQSGLAAVLGPSWQENCQQQQVTVPHCAVLLGWVHGHTDPWMHWQASQKDRAQVVSWKFKNGKKGSIQVAL